MLKPAKKPVDPHKHIQINSGLTFISAVVSLAMAITLFAVFAGKPGSHWLIYLAQGLFTANFFWQAQTFWRTRLLKKHLPKKREENEQEKSELKGGTVTSDLLMPASAEDEIKIPASVTENTTKLLKKQ